MTETTPWLRVARELREHADSTARGLSFGLPGTPVRDVHLDAVAALAEAIAEHFAASVALIGE